MPAPYDFADAIARLAEVVKRGIDLFDPDPERRRQVRLSRAQERVRDQEDRLKKAIAEAKKFTLPLILLCLTCCVRYLPKDAEQYRQELNECRHDNEALVREIERYMTDVQALRDDCR